MLAVVEVCGGQAVLEAVTSAGARTRRSPGGMLLKHSFNYLVLMIIFWSRMISVTTYWNVLRLLYRDNFTRIRSFVVIVTV